MSAPISQFELVAKALEAAALRHQVISNNIANVNTPGYQALEVSFEEQLSRAMMLELETLDQLSPEVRRAEGLAMRNDGNNVDIDREIGKLGKNSVTYQTLVQVLASQMGMLRSAISGR